MKETIVMSGELYNKLDAISKACGNIYVVRLPVYRPVAPWAFVGEADPIRPQIEYEEWEKVYTVDGFHSWMRR